MGRLAAKTMRVRVRSFGPALPVSLVALGYLVVPLVLVVQGSIGRSEAGFHRGASVLGVIALRSIYLSLLPALLSTALSLIASLLGVFHPRFSKSYRVWLFVLLFTNPVFIVFGFSILLAQVPPYVAVVLASTYVLMPFCGQIIQAAVDEFDLAQVRAARCLGASPLFVAVRHILPFVRQQALASVLLSAIYALGFFLIPTYVGLGRAVTLATVIYTLTNSIGDWTAACQMCIVAIVTQLILILLWVCAAHLSTPSQRRL